MVRNHEGEIQRFSNANGLVLIKRTFEFAVDRDWIVKNPMKNLTVSRDDGTSRNPVSVEKMQSFLDFVKTEKHSHHCWELIHVLFWTGMRASKSVV